VIAVSQALKQAVIDLGIPEEKIFPSERRGHRKILSYLQGRSARSIGACSRMILSVGNLTPNKGFDLLIRSLPIVRDQTRRKGCRVGDRRRRTFRNELDATISRLRLDGRVHLVGAVPHEQLHLWYSAADVFCLASEREGWPNVILESLACGTPVVATPAGGIPEILSSETLGLLTERDERKIAGAIVTALNKKWMSDNLWNTPEIIVGTARLRRSGRFPVGFKFAEDACGFRESDPGIIDETQGRQT
jgi:teichuronic acid biosynthesis glycosyltransferase TuaC